jgi:hypothetical protein
MLLFPVGYPRMETTEETGYPGWNLLKTGLPRMEYVYPAAFYMLQFPDRPAWMETKLNPRTAAVDGWASAEYIL